MLGHRVCGLPVSSLGLLALLPLSSAWSIFGTRATGDLSDVLGSEKNLSTYRQFVKDYPDIFSKLPEDDGVTLVVPNNDAFAKYHELDPKNKSMVANVLKCHMLQGTINTAAMPVGESSLAATLLTDKAYANVTDGQRVLMSKGGDNLVVFSSGLGSRCTIVDPDIPFTGGTIQVVDALMVPPVRLEPTIRDAYKDLTSFLGALYATDLVSAFADSPDVTIFAPRNAAFQLLAGTLEGLSREALAKILRYHLVPGKVLASTDIKNGSEITTGAADSAPDLKVFRSGNNMYFNRAQLLQPDILIANGVIHIIDALLNPDSDRDDVTPDPVIGTQTPGFPVTGSKTATGTDEPVPFTSVIPCTSACPVEGGGGGGGVAGGGAKTTGLNTASSSGVGAATRPRCTSGAAAAAVGAAAAAGLLAGGVGMEVVGLV